MYTYVCAYVYACVYMFKCAGVRISVYVLIISFHFILFYFSFFFFFADDQSCRPKRHAISSSVFLNCIQGLYGKKWQMTDDNNQTLKILKERKNGKNGKNGKKKDIYVYKYSVNRDMITIHTTQRVYVHIHWSMCNNMCIFPFLSKKSERGLELVCSFLLYIYTSDGTFCRCVMALYDEWQRIHANHDMRRHMYFYMCLYRWLLKCIIIFWFTLN